MTCPGCRADNPEGARFCLNCGGALEAPRPVEGERKLVTVLFADVVGSTGMAERLDPEQMVEIMNGAFAFMNAAVARYEGTVARLMGDAVLALFGAPVAHEDDAERAVRAGLEIRSAAVEYAASVRRAYGSDFQVRVGINTGLVIAGEVGSRLGTEYTAMGDAANVAARLQGVADPGVVLISANTYRFVKHLFDVRPCGAISVRGRSVPIETFEVTAARAAPSRARGLDGVHSPLVGRGAEVALLLARLHALGHGAGGFVAVVGEAGLGKSRLVAEVREQVELDELQWVEGRALSYTRSVVYYPWRQLLRTAIGAQVADPPDAVREKLRSAWERSGAAADDLPFLETILGVESGSSLGAIGALGGDALVQRLGEAVLAYLRSLAHVAPVVLVFDDLHWADSASLELLLGVAELAQASPILLLCVLRPEKQAASWRFLERARDRLGGLYTQLELAPLPAAQAEKLLKSLLDIRGLPAAVREVILQKSEGNPFFMEEVLRGLIDSGHVVPQRGRWRATGEIVNVAIPDSVAGVLSARIDRLPEQTKRVVQTAAVVGRIFARRLLTEVCRLAPPPERIEDVDPHLDTLTYEELVRERARYPELEYIFKHSLTQEAAYELLLVRRRRELHRRTAQVLEQLYGENSDERAATLAHHYLRAEEWLQGAEHSARAGERAVRLYALPDALDHYDRAYRALRNLEEQHPDRLIDVLLEWVLVAYFLKRVEQPHERDEILQRLEHAEQLARARVDKRHLTRVLVWRSNVLMLGGFPTESFPMLRESHRLALELGDEEQALLPLFGISWWMVDDDPRGSISMMQKVIEDARRFAHLPGAREIEAHALAVLGIGLARLGDFAAARQALQEALRLAPESGSTIKEADVELAAAMAYYDMGDIQQALAYSRSGTAKALSIQGMECACTGTFLTGFGNLQAHDLEGARRSFADALEMVAPLGSGMKGEKNRIRAGLAVVRFLGGDTEALQELEDAVEKAHTLNDGYGAAFIAQQLGESYIQVGAFDRAEAHLNSALDFYRGAGLRPYAVRTLHSLSRVYDELGRDADAGRVRAEAESIGRELPLAGIEIFPGTTTPAATPLHHDVIPGAP